jgi:hypothetical protein
MFLKSKIRRDLIPPGLDYNNALLRILSYIYVGEIDADPLCTKFQPCKTVPLLSGYGMISDLVFRKPLFGYYFVFQAWPCVLLISMGPCYFEFHNRLLDTQITMQCTGEYLFSS